MTYIDGTVIPVPIANRQDYLAMAKTMAALLVRCGALHVVENWSDDVPRGKQTDFYRAVDAEDGEAVAFSWIIWPSKAVRDAGWAEAMADPAMASGVQTLFDGKRMIFGGFETIFDSAEAGA